ncbi:hypothetical protein C8J57DRAFT_316465, partial [Mycena rebaudengoi]
YVVLGYKYLDVSLYSPLNCLSPALTLSSVIRTIMPPTRTEEHSESGFMFRNARNFAINNGTFNIIDNRYQLLPTVRTSSSGASPLPIASDESIEFVRQLICGMNYRIHAAKLEGRAVAVKVFSGTRAQEDHDEAVATGRNWMHPNFLQIMGCSSKYSPDPFIIYHGVFEGSAKCMIASVLREELSKCLLLGVQLVHGISSGLSYLEDKRYPLEYVEPTDFDLLIGNDGNLKLCFKRNPLSPSDCDMDSPTSLAQTQQRHAALELFDNLCRMAFKDANRQLYRDEVDRTTDTAPDFLTGSYSTINLDSFLGQQSPTEASISVGSAGRRELIWKSSDKGVTLAEVSEQAQEFLFYLRTAHTGRIIRHYVSSTKSKSYHRCPGYSREEIILGSQAHSTVIVSHSTPSPREVCTVCGHIVEDGGWFRCGCGKPDDGLEPTTNCIGCNSWHHVHCSCVGGLLTPTTSQEGAAASPRATKAEGRRRNGQSPTSTAEYHISIEDEDAYPKGRQEASNEDLEDFLPSSLTDLLTPEERSRRRSRFNSAQPPTSLSRHGLGLVPSRSASLKRGDDAEVYSPRKSPSLNRTPQPSGSHATRASTAAPRLNSNAVADAVQQPRRVVSRRQTL